MNEEQLPHFEHLEINDFATQTESPYDHMGIYDFHIIIPESKNKLPDFIGITNLLENSAIVEFTNITTIGESSVIPSYFEHINFSKNSKEFKAQKIGYSYEKKIDYEQIARDMAERRAKEAILAEDPDAVEIVYARDAVAMREAMDEAFRDFYPDVDGYGVFTGMGYYNGAFVETREPSRAMVTTAEPDLEWMKAHNANIDASCDPDKAEWKFVAVEVRRKPTEADISREQMSTGTFYDFPGLYSNPEYEKPDLDRFKRTQVLGRIVITDSLIFI